MTEKTESLQICRSVKTLLLCKVEIGSENNIKELYTGKTECTDWDKADQYFALGDFDAFSIYDTCKQPNDNNWLSEVYNDRLQISKEAGRLYSYNPIHLVSVGTEAQHNDVKNFCAATIIYGWKDNTSPIEASISKAIQSLQETNTSQGEESDLQYSVYQAVNICDAVILWRSDSYNRLCRKTMSLLQCGFARKTYTIIGARYTVRNDKIEFFCQNSDESSKAQIRGSIRNIDGARAWLQNLHKVNEADHGGVLESHFHSFSFLSGGFDFVEDYHNLHISRLLPNLMSTNQTNGSNTEPPFWDMRTDVITEEPDRLPVGANARTGAGTASSGGEEDSNKPITNALNRLYNKFIDEYHEKLLSDQANGITEDWPYSYGELLGVTASIDQNPALRTPAYLMFDYLRVCDVVFQHVVEGSEGYDQLLSDSLEKLKKAIHSWNQLIDQTIRTDELVIKGIGFASSIYNSVPVQLVDFYNSMINNFVRTLLRAGDQDAPDYAFLLLLNQSYQIRITPLFSDLELRRSMVKQHCTESGSPRNCNGCKFKDRNNNCWRKKCWPYQQVYLVELPTDALYKPTELIISLAHEVFHIFGDQFRNREYRWRLFGQAVIQIILRSLHIDEDWGDDDTTAYRTMARTLAEHLKIRPGDLTVYSPNLLETKEYFSENLSQLLRFQPIDVFSSASGKDWAYYLSTRLFVKAWERLRNDLFIKKLQNEEVGIVQEFKQLEYFLKECFADICAIRVLKIQPSEYLMALNRGISPASHLCSIHRMLQRAMITTVSCIWSYGLINANGSKKLNDRGKKMCSAYSEWAKKICTNFKNIQSDENAYPLVMKRFENAASKNDKAIARQLFGKKDEHVQFFFKWACTQYNINSADKNALEQLQAKIEKNEPRTKAREQKDIDAEKTLSYYMASDLEAIVLEYLSSVNRIWDTELKKKKNSDLSSYSKKFHHLIRNSQFFTEDFMREIDQYHGTIDGIADKMIHSSI